jgi:hypothetical protein
MDGIDSKKTSLPANDDSQENTGKASGTSNSRDDGQLKKGDRIKEYEKSPGQKSGKKNPDKKENENKPLGSETEIDDETTI